MLPPCQVSMIEKRYKQASTPGQPEENNFFSCDCINEYLFSNRTPGQPENRNLEGEEWKAGSDWRREGGASQIRGSGEREEKRGGGGRRGGGAGPEERGLRLAPCSAPRGLATVPYCIDFSYPSFSSSDLTSLADCSALGGDHHRRRSGSD